MKQNSILVVDDDQYIINVMSRALTREGYDVRTAMSGEAALEALGTKYFDLIISDQMMSGITGSALFERAKEVCSDAIRILMTGHPDVGILMEAINKGEIYRFITKPVELADLLITVRYALQQKGLVNEKAELSNLLQEKERLERIVVNSRNKLMAIFDTINERVFSVDPDYAIVSANKAFCESVHEAPAKIIGQKCYSVKHGLDAPCFEYGYECPAKEVFNSGNPYSDTAVYADREGRRQYNEFSILPVRNNEGKIVQAIRISRDITAQKEAEEALRESESRYRTLYESSSDAIMLLDEQGFFDCNQATLKMLGYKNKNELTSVHPADVSPAYQPNGV
ncbi:MAG: response regulator, partial [Pseudomonadota bacterium]